ncbi:MAG: CoA-substrate-specific enzyme activase [Chloroflexi bacterium]|nr:CoA-substrate-specific enzyme activase [Chloroflexota bacterium]
MAYAAGIDIGSSFSKIVVLDNRNLVIARSVLTTSGSYRSTSERVVEEGLKKAGLGLEALVNLVATGIGAASVPFPNQPATEASCAARGVNFLFPGARTVIEIGGQSSRIIGLTEKGKVTDYVTSEKCAGGNGRFLQVIARVLKVKLEDIGEISLKSRNRVIFTTGCAVFCESEAISRVAEGALKEDILAGVHYSIANKIAGLLGRVTLQKECVIIGGGARDRGLVKSIEEAAGIELRVPEEPGTTIALGAALIARDKNSGKRDS